MDEKAQSARIEQFAGGLTPRRITRRSLVNKQARLQTGRRAFQRPDQGSNLEPSG